MPIYEYQCCDCGQIEEAFQKISDAPLEQCSRCQGKLQKLISMSAFHLKGSGWYVTDYGGTSAKKESSSPEKKADDTASKKKDSAGTASDK